LIDPYLSDSLAKKYRGKTFAHERMMPVPVAPEALKEILEKNLRDLKPDIALLHVNGRDEYRRSHNVPGYFHFEEAIALCHRTGIAYLIPHHYGMFKFNSVDRAIGLTGSAPNALFPIDNRHVTSLSNYGKNGGSP
jgi:L-ascorbate metabolism protein UlaG (beta-lactamase superfamily)